MDFGPAAASPSLPPRRAPRPQDLPQNPPPAYPARGPEPWPGPFEGPPTGREGMAARVGLAAAFWFSAKFICMCFSPNRLTRKGPTLHLPWRRPRREEGPSRTRDSLPSSRDEKKKRQGKNRERKKRKKRKRANGKTPTLEPGRRSQKGPTKLPLERGPVVFSHPPYAVPPARGPKHWGNRGEGRLTLSRS